MIQSYTARCGLTLLRRGKARYLCLLSSVKGKDTRREMQVLKECKGSVWNGKRSMVSETGRTTPCSLLCSVAQPQGARCWEEAVLSGAWRPGASADSLRSSPLGKSEKSGQRPKVMIEYLKLSEKARWKHHCWEEIIQTSSPSSFSHLPPPIPKCLFNADGCKCVFNKLWVSYALGSPFRLRCGSVRLLPPYRHGSEKKQPSAAEVKLACGVPLSSACLWEGLRRAG